MGGLSSWLLLPDDQHTHEEAGAPSDSECGKRWEQKGKAGDGQESAQQGSRRVGRLVRKRGGIAESRIPEKTGDKGGYDGEQKNTERRKRRPVAGDENAGACQKLQARGIEQGIQTPFRPAVAAKKSAQESAAEDRRGIVWFAENEGGKRLLPCKDGTQKRPEQTAENTESACSRKRARGMPGM